MFRLLRFVGLLVAWTVTLAVPLLAVWIASSLAAYRLGMAELAAGAGLLLFPVLPLVWDLWGERKRRRRGDKRERILTRGDRVLLRTFALNAAFVGVMLGAFASDVFMATASRGDWFLDGIESAEADVARDVLHTTSLGLEWVHTWAINNAWDELADDGVQLADGDDAPDDDALPDEDIDPDAIAELDADRNDPGGEAEVDRPPVVPGTVMEGRPLWPLPPTPHPALISLPSTDAQTIEGVAVWLKQNTNGEADLAKAIHDFVALHVDYDAPALAEGRYPPQDAQTVFDTGVGVCAGYANLFATMATHAGLEARYVTGDSRSWMTGEVGDVGHAWNVVKVDGTWRLVDVTWNAGSVDGRVFTERYDTGYLFTPPAVFGETHFPENPEWQLRGDDPIDRATFVRQLVAQPSFHRAGLRYVTPDRSPVEAGDRVRVVMDNPQQRGVWLHVRREDGDGQPCAPPSDRSRVEVTCRVPGPGVWYIMTSLRETGADTYWGVSSVRVVR